MRSRTVKDTGEAARIADRVRRLVPAAFLPALVTVSLAAAVVLVATVLSGEPFTAVSATVATIWLVIHNVPFTIDGTTIGFLPVLPTIVMVAVTARTTSRAVPEDPTARDVAATVVAIIGGPLVVSAAAYAVIEDASRVLPISTPAAGEALGWTLVVHLLGAGFGLGRELRRTLLLRLGVPAWVPLAFRAAARWIAAIWAAGAVAVTSGLLLGIGRATALVEVGDGIVGFLSLTLLSVLYAPNLMLAAAGVLAGGDVVIGRGFLSLFEYVPTRLPGLPIVAVFPDVGAAPWWPVFLVVPAAAAVLVGRWVVRASGNDAAAPTVVLAAAVIGGAFAVAIAVVTGGELGVYGWSGVTPWLFGAISAGWLALVGIATVLVLGGGRRRVSVRHGLGEGDAADAAESDAADDLESDGDVSGMEGADGTEPVTDDPDDAAPTASDTADTADADAAPDADADAAPTAPDVADDTAGDDGGQTPGASTGDETD